MNQQARDFMAEQRDLGRRLRATTCLNPLSEDLGTYARSLVMMVSWTLLLYASVSLLLSKRT